MEVVFRFGLPEGSSFRKRIKNKSYLEEVLQNLPDSYSNKFMDDLCNGHYDNGLWDFPIIEFSTKWEPEDRFVTYDEAQEISGLGDSEWTTFIEWNRLAAIQLRSFFKKIDLVLWDGKCEWGVTNDEAPFSWPKKFCFS